MGSPLSKCFIPNKDNKCEHGSFSDLKEHLEKSTSSDVTELTQEEQSSKPCDNKERDPSTVTNGLTFTLPGCVPVTSQPRLQGAERALVREIETDAENECVKESTLLEKRKVKGNESKKNKKGKKGKKQLPPLKTLKTPQSVREDVNAILSAGKEAKLERPKAAHYKRRLKNGYHHGNSTVPSSTSLSSLEDDAIGGRPMPDQFSIISDVSSSSSSSSSEEEHFTQNSARPKAAHYKRRLNKNTDGTTSATSAVHSAWSLHLPKLKFGRSTFRTPVKVLKAGDTAAYVPGTIDLRDYEEKQEKKKQHKVKFTRVKPFKKLGTLTTAIKTLKHPWTSYKNSRPASHQTRDVDTPISSMAAERERALSPNPDWNHDDDGLPTVYLELEECSITDGDDCHSPQSNSTGEQNNVKSSWQYLLEGQMLPGVIPDGDGEMTKELEVAKNTDVTPLSDVGHNPIATDSSLSSQHDETDPCSSEQEVDMETMDHKWTGMQAQVRGETGPDSKRESLDMMDRFLKAQIKMRQQKANLTIEEDMEIFHLLNVRKKLLDLIKDIDKKKEKVSDANSDVSSSPSDSDASNSTTCKLGKTKKKKRVHFSTPLETHMNAPME